MKRNRRQTILLLSLALAAAVILAGTTWAQARKEALGDAERIAVCRQRIATSGASIDFACLRIVYSLPISQWPAPQIDAGVAWSELAPLPDKTPQPADNPSTAAKVELGRKLFEEPRLSRSGQIACANCHDRELAWGDGRGAPFGHDRQRGRRNAMSIAMSAYSHPLFWDGRAATLEEQALLPIQDPKEMAFTLGELEERLNRDPDYPAQFEQVFGQDRIDAQQIALAIAAYERTLVPRSNLFDRFLKGQRTLLSDQQLWGLHLFRTQARCMNCHSGPALSDNTFHNLGLHLYGRPRQDLGRYEVTGDPADSGKFRTPTLRNVANTGPWMHNGMVTTLRGAVHLYNVGMLRPQPTPEQATDPLFPQPDPLLRPLQLEEAEVDAITEFLQSLS